MFVFGLFIYIRFKNAQNVFHEVIEILANNCIEKSQIAYLCFKLVSRN